MLLLKEFINFNRTGTNTPEGYQKMIALYCKSNGFSNYFLSKFVSCKNRKSTKEIIAKLHQETSDILKWNDNNDYLIKQLKNDGYVVLKTKLPKELCHDLREFAESKKSLPSGLENKIENFTLYKKSDPKAPTYNFDETDLINNPIIQSLSCDPRILSVVAQYLKAPPILDLVAMWWSTCFMKGADARSAQLYHFDMDRLHWLKVFFYLTDVDSDTGAHCYVAKSHRPGQKPKEIRARGYSRIPDSDLKKFYPGKNFNEIEGVAGTIIIGDTAAYHKGKPLVRDHRLVLEFEYTNSMFGAPTSSLFINKPTPAFINRSRLHPKMFEKYKFV